MRESIVYQASANHSFIQKISRLSVPRWSTQPGCHALVQCLFGLECYQDRLFADYHIPFPAELKRAVNRRKAEYLAGRIAARYALQQVQCSPFEVPYNIERVPHWPKGVCGSISHSANYALSFVQPKTHCQSVGVDIEQVITDKLALDIYDVVAELSELSLLTDIGFTFAQAVTLIFSAKESLYKLLYPLTHYFFDFFSVELKEVNKIRQCLSFRLKQQMTNLVPLPADPLTVYYACQQSRVLTLTQLQ